MARSVARSSGACSRSEWTSCGSPAAPARTCTALLVNAARGRLVDRDALADALYADRIRAAIDVADPEPLPTEDRLWSAPNLLLTPHMAGDTPRRFRRSWQLVGEQIERLRTGRPLLNVVAPPRPS